MRLVKVGQEAKLADASLGEVWKQSTGAAKAAQVALRQLTEVFRQAQLFNGDVSFLRL